MTQELTEKDVEDAGRWLKETPGSDAVVAVGFLALLHTRGAVSEETAVSHNEADRFATYVSDLMSDVRMLGLMVRGLVEMKWDRKKKDWTYCLTEEGRQTSGDLEHDAKKGG